MKEVITFLIISGGLGFFNLYIAQESDLLYFGKYNKEERLAWLSIYTIINFLLIKTGIVIFKALSTIHFGVIVSILISVLTLIIDLIGTLLLPVFINWLIKIIRILLKKNLALIYRLPIRFLKILINGNYLLLISMGNSFLQALYCKEQKNVKKIYY